MGREENGVAGDLLIGWNQHHQDERCNQPRCDIARIGVPADTDPCH